MIFMAHDCQWHLLLAEGVYIASHSISLLHWDVCTHYTALQCNSHLHYGHSCVSGGRCYLSVGTAMRIYKNRVLRGPHKAELQAAYVGQKACCLNTH